MATATVPGGTPGSPPLTFTYSSGAGLTVAQQIANALGAATKAGTLTQNTTAGAASGQVSIPGASVAGGVSNLVIESLPGATTITGSGGIATNNSSTPSTITAGAGVELFTGSVGGVYSTSSTGAMIGAISGANTITASGSGETIGGGTGTDLLIVSGTGDVVQSAGTDTINSSGSGNLIFGTSTSVTGSMVVNESGTNDTIIGGANPTTVTATGTSTVVGSGPQVFAGPGDMTFVGGAQMATILGGGGSESITAGAGGVVFAANTANNATVNSGTGGATIFGAPNIQVNLVGSFGTAAHPNVLLAAGGNETLNAAGSSSSNIFVSHSGTGTANTQMIGGSGNDTMVAGAGAGSVTMTGGAGSDVYAFFKNSVATDVVKDFASGESIFIEGYATTSSAAQLLANATVNGAAGPGVTLGLSDGTTITFSNLTSASQLNGAIKYN